jgi:hypothetical protein
VTGLVAFRNGMTCRILGVGPFAFKLSRGSRRALFRWGDSDARVRARGGGAFLRPTDDNLGSLADASRSQMELATTKERAGLRQEARICRSSAAFAGVTWKAL